MSDLTGKACNIREVQGEGVKFEIEQVLFVQSLARTFILARQLAPSEWTLGDDPHLGGVQIQKWIDIPRAHDVYGNQRLDLFAFVLRDNAMASRLSVGQVVELEP